MNYGRLNKTDIANGSGVRVSLFVSGCRNHCKGCFNPETWDFNYGQEFTTDTVNEIMEALEPNYISGLSVLGGDPFESENIDVITDLCKAVREKYPNKTIWVYTGYKFEILKVLDIMKYIDVLVDGRFIESQKDLSLIFRGSRNQRIIDVKRSLSSRQIELLEVME